MSDISYGTKTYRVCGDAECPRCRQPSNLMQSYCGRCGLLLSTRCRYVIRWWWRLRFAWACWRRGAKPRQWKDEVAELSKRAEERKQCEVPLYDIDGRQAFVMTPHQIKWIHGAMKGMRCIR